MVIENGPAKDAKKTAKGSDQLREKVGLWIQLDF
jgi:hypothetical protein